MYGKQLSAFSPAGTGGALISVHMTRSGDLKRRFTGGAKQSIEDTGFSRMAGVPKDTQQRSTPAD